MKIFALYFSATGNTKFAVEKFCKNFEESEIHSIEELIDFKEASKEFDTLLVAYPIYGSDMPLLMKDFLREHQTIFQDKNLITLVTQLMFSGDGGALASRMLSTQSKKHLASIHINMPSNINLPPFVTIKNGQENSAKIAKAIRKIDRCADKLAQGRSVHNGKGVFCFLAGYLTQRMWFKSIYETYKNKITIDRIKCTSCGLCTKSCPTGNLQMSESGPEQQNRCMLCYRCINQCPACAITLFSKKDSEVQYNGMF